MIEEGWLVSLQHEDFSESFVTGVDIAKDMVLISGERGDASIFETMKEACDFLDLVRPNLLGVFPKSKFFIDEL